MADSRQQPADPAGIDRRQALKRGALVGGALVWTAPVVQAFAMSSASADDGSDPTRRTDRGTASR